MMNSKRTFLKKAALVAGLGSVVGCQEQSSAERFASSSMASAQGRQVGAPPPGSGAAGVVIAESAAEVSQHAGEPTALLLLKSVHAGLGRGGGLLTWREDDPFQEARSESARGAVVFEAAGNGFWTRALDEPVRATWFGARGTGEGDDGPALQAALDFVGASRAGADGGALHVPSGTYRIAQPLTLPSHVYLLGESKISTRLQPATDGTDVLRVTEDASYGAIKRIAFFNPGDTPGQNTAVEFLGGNHNDFILEDLHVWGFAVGIRGRKLWMSRLEGINVRQCDRGFHFDGGYTTLSLTGCYAGHCGDGFLFRGVDTVTFISCAADASGRYGFRLANGSYNLSTCHAEGSRFTADDAAVIQLEGPCTAGIDGFCTVGVGTEGAALKMIECVTDEGPVMANVRGFRQEKTKTPASVKRINVRGKQAASSAVSFEGCLWDVTDDALQGATLRSDGRVMKQ